MRWLFTVYGTASPTASGASGDFTLTSPDVNSSFTVIRLPKGLKAKVWAKRLSGTVGYTLLINYTTDVTQTTPSWTTVDVEYLSSAGSLEIEKRRPIVVSFKTGKEAIKLSYSNTTGAGSIFASVDIEVSDEDE